MSAATHLISPDLSRKGRSADEMASNFASVPYTAPDPIFDLTAKFLVDQFPQKVNLGQGTYRDERGQPWVLPAVRAAEEGLRSSDHEYLPILGLKDFREKVPGLILGNSSPAIKTSRVCIILLSPHFFFVLRPKIDSIFHRLQPVKHSLEQELCICSATSSSHM